MNTTTFTIESVHGVKQTFVLGTPAKAAQNGPQKQQPAELQRDSDAKRIPDASRTSR